MNEGTHGRSPATIVLLVALALALGFAAFVLFVIGMCTGDGICGDSTVQLRLAYAGALVGAAGAGAALAGAVRPRRGVVAGGAAAALALMAYAITQVRA